MENSDGLGGAGSGAERSAEAEPDAGYYGFDRPEVIAHAAPFISQLIEEKGALKALDVGCAAGGFGTALRAAFAEVSVDGVEIVQSAAAIAAGKLDQVYAQAFDETLVERLDKKYDLIFFNDCFEHIFDSVGTLDIARAITSDDALLIFSIPNVRYFKNLGALIFGKDWRYRDAGILDDTHVRFFTRKSFDRLVREHGLEPISISGLSVTRNPIYKLIMGLFDVVTLGRHSDIKYLQHLFVLRKTR